MPLPAVSLAGIGIGSLVGPFISDVFLPGHRTLAAIANAGRPNAMPSVDQLVTAYWKGYLNYGDLSIGCRFHGVGLQLAEYSDIWAKVLDATKPPIHESTIGRLAAAGTWNAEKFILEMKRAGVSDPEARDMLLDSIGIPSWQWCLARRRLGEIPDEKWNTITRVHGIGPNGWGPVWDKVTAPLGSGTATRLWTHGALTEERASRHVQADGIINPGDADAVFRLALAEKAATIEVLLQLLRLGIINQGDYDQLSTMAGYAQGPWKDLAEKRSATIPLGQVLDLWNRGAIGIDRVRQHLAAAGFVNESDRNAITQLRYVNPTTAEVARWATIISADNAAEGALSVTSELPAAALDAARATGLFGAEFKASGIQGNEQSYPAVMGQWAAHWNVPGPARALEAYIRLTPARIAQLNNAGIAVSGLTEAQLNQLFRAANVPPGWREFEKALYFQPIGLRHLTLAIDTGLLNHAQAAERFRQIGFLPEDAELMVKIREEAKLKPWKHIVEQFELKSSKEYIQLVIDSVVTGYIPRNNAVEQLKIRGFTETSANNVIDLAIAKYNHKVAEKGVAAVKHAWEHGEVDDDGATQRLAQIGIGPDAILRNLAEWRIEFRYVHKHAATAQIARWLTDGLINRQQAETRLRNIGWPQPDIALFLGDAAQKIAAAHAKEQASEEKGRRKAAADLERLVNTHERDLKRLRNRLKMLTPLGALKKWFTDGIVNSDYVTERLRAIGYPDDIIIKYLNDWVLDASKPKSRAKTGKAPQANGTTQPPATPGA